jgi:hypothetical protein
MEINIFYIMNLYIYLFRLSKIIKITSINKFWNLNNFKIN